MAPHYSEVPSKYIQYADISVQFPHFPHTAMYSVNRQIAHEYALRTKIQIPTQPIDLFVREDWKYEHPQHPPLETLEPILSLVKDVEVWLSDPWLFATSNEFREIILAYVGVGQCLAYAGWNPKVSYARAYKGRDQIAPMDRKAEGAIAESSSGRRSLHRHLVEDGADRREKVACEDVRSLRAADGKDYVSSKCGAGCR